MSMDILPVDHARGAPSRLTGASTQALGAHDRATALLPHRSIGSCENLKRRGQHSLALCLSLGAALSAALPAAMAHAQQPIPFRYVDTAVDPATDDDRHWSQYFAADMEVALRQPSFVAHLKIDRPASVQELGVLYVSRLCQQIASGMPALSKCPAVLTRYRAGAEPDRRQLEAPVCLVHFGDKPPRSSNIGFNEAQATARRENDQSFLVLSAVLGGELVPDCTVTVPLGPP
jgi:hypothetical protein